MNSFRLLVVAVVVTLVTATACRQVDDVSQSGAAGGTPTADETDRSPSSPDDGSTASAEEPEAGSESASYSEPSDRVGGASTISTALTEEDLSLPPARGIDELAAGPDAEPVPTSISIERLGLAATTVRTVGVEPNGEMTVPPAREVGWYRYGPTPGEAGSAVLAGHVASGGVPGAFRYLDELEPGDLVTVGFDDGSSQTWVVDDLFQVDKTALPFDTLFARSGTAKLALITCGGQFDYDARSYDDNIVVTASPISG